MRWAVPVFGATAMLTVPSPVPLPLPLTVSQAALLVVLHAHELPAVTPTAVVSPAAGDVRDAGVME